ncbi:MAG TPA: polyhydroxyalkanoate granule-associated phasin [Burkholderiaceae bacterium]|nr:polyhydroxyalkanoate granule-associated phasin [Burkholderiaceae bacterium]
MNKRARRSALRIGTQTAELMFAAPQVVAHRLRRIGAAGAGTNARDQREFQRMGAEKIAAFGESWNQMALQMVKANQQVAQAWMSAWWFPLRMTSGAAARRSLARAAAQMQGSALRVMSRGLGPVHRRATANAKRLQRVKVR